ncbi:MAG: ATP-binding protein [Candidatus Magnetoovum sp. WYHC-5]|nr:ATP-binding protein [Candidatus Magnetoovum sp. WYHC-5]
MTKLLNKMSLAWKLSLFFCIVVAGLFVTGYTSYINMGKIKSGLDIIYFGNMIPIGDLNTITTMYSKNIIETIDKTKEGHLSIKDGKNKILYASNVINKKWDAYTATYYTPEEERDRKAADLLVLAANRFIDMVLGYYESENIASIKAITNEEIYTAIEPAVNVINKLIDFEYNSAKIEKNKANSIFSRTGKALLYTIIIIAFFIIALSTPIMQNIRANQQELESFSVYQKQLNEKLQKERDRLSSFTTFLSTLHSVDIYYIASRTIKQIVEATNSQIGLFYRYVEEKLELIASVSIDDKALASEYFSVSSEGLPLKAINSAQWLTVKDITSDVSMPLIDTGLFKIPIKSVTAIPIIFQKQKLGAIVIASISDKKEEGAYLEGYINTLAHALNNAISYQTVQMQTQRLKLANMELASANRLKSEFLANVSHELRTPLNSVIGFSNLLLKNREGSLGTKSLNYLEKINRNGVHLLKIINDILDLSKIEAGRMEIDKGRFSVIPTVSNTVDMLRPQADNKNVSIELINKLDEDIEIESDEQKIQQILINLIGNAIKFVEPITGKIEVIIEKNDKQGLNFSVKDNGKGIPEDKQAAIFEAFTQVDSSSTKEYGGTGLGLTISKSIAERIGGKIDVVSKYGEGATFTLSFPLCPEITEVVDMEEHKSHFTDIREITNDQIYVLQIDDDDDSRKIMTEYMKDCGYQLITAKNGADGLNKAKAFKPDLILLDILLPDMSGWEVLKALKSEHATSHIPVIIISVVADEKIAFTLGAVESVSKSTAKDDIMNVIKSTFAKKEERYELSK